MDKQELMKLVDGIENFNSMKHSQKITVYGYYLTHISNEPYFDQKMIRNCYQLLDDFPPANISDFLQKLKSTKKLVPINGGYRLHRSESDKITKLLRNNIAVKTSGENGDENIPSITSKMLAKPPNLGQIVVLPDLNPTKEQFDNNKASIAIALIKGFDTLQLPKFRVVGNYIRFDDDLRNTLKKLKQKIIEGLEPHATGNENYLIWGPPGSGKTYFVQEVAKSLGNNICYHELNLAKFNQQRFKTELTKIEKNEKSCICLIDEADSESSGKWAYEILLTYLFPSKPRKFRICFILAGSSGTNMDAMKKKISTQNKGNDLLSRIPSRNEYVVTPFSTGDYLVVGASQFIKTSIKHEMHIREIEKLALFYIAVDPQFSTARQLHELVESSMRRIPKGEEQIKYDYLFDAGDPINKEFWEKAKLFDPSLFNSFILIEDDQT